MDLPLGRLRQITAAINRRQFFDERQKINFGTWQTRQIAIFIAQGYMTDKENPAIEAAQNLYYDDIEKLQLEEAQKRHAENPVAKENNNGSFERFMGSMGSPGRWAGR